MQGTGILSLIFFTYMAMMRNLHSYKKHNICGLYHVGDINLMRFIYLLMFIFPHREDDWEEGEVRR